MIECSVCRYKYLDEEAYKNHMRNCQHNVESFKEKSPFQCPTCSKTFRLLSNLSKHVQTQKHLDLAKWYQENYGDKPITELGEEIDQQFEQDQDSKTVYLGNTEPEIVSINQIEKEPVLEQPGLEGPIVDTFLHNLVHQREQEIEAVQPQKEFSLSDELNTFEPDLIISEHDRENELKEKKMDVFMNRLTYEDNFRQVVERPGTKKPYPVSYESHAVWKRLFQLRKKPTLGQFVLQVMIGLKLKDYPIVYNFMKYGLGVKVEERKIILEALISFQKIVVNSIKKGEKQIEGKNLKEILILMSGWNLNEYRNNLNRITLE